MTRRTPSIERMRAGWYAYDWANSAYAVTILAALFGPYLDKVVVPKTGQAIPALGIGPLSSTSLYGYTLGLSALLVMLVMPILGAMADFSASKRKFLITFCYIGSAATLAMGWIGPGDVFPALALFFIANFSFVSANVFYDAFLPQIATPAERDTVSGRGYSWGYAGGGLLFLLHLLLIQFHDVVGIADAESAVRIALGSVGLWWGGFSIITFTRLQEAQTDAQHPGFRTLAMKGFRRVVSTFKHVRTLPNILLFLGAFMVYNDGIQTIIAMSTIFGSEELGFSTLTLMGCLLMIQIVGIIGSWLFAVIARRIGARNAILISLVIWSLIAVYGYTMTEPWQFWLIGVGVGLVLGGSQALSRSLFAKIIPPEAAAEFFGFFSVFEKFSAIFGPILFAFLRQATGSARASILALFVVFVLGILMLALVSVPKAEEEGHFLGDLLAAESES